MNCIQKTSHNLRQLPGSNPIYHNGTTLLDLMTKSGIAEIMTAIECQLVQNPDIKHCVCVGPDEEIGVGADKFDVEDFDVDFAYTMDGGPLGELQYETFSAAAKVDFLGRNVHPGSRPKIKMINTFQLAIDFHNALPKKTALKNGRLSRLLPLDEHGR